MAAPMPCTTNYPHSRLIIIFTGSYVMAALQPAELVGKEPKA